MGKCGVIMVNRNDTAVIGKSFCNHTADPVLDFRILPGTIYGDNTVENNICMGNAGDNP